MYSVLGKPYLSLDKFVDVTSLDTIIDDIILGIAKSRASAGPTNSGPGYVDKTKNSVPEIYRKISGDPSHPYYDLLTSLRDWEPQTFIQYKWPSHVLGQCIILRLSTNYENKNSNASTKNLPAIKHFQSLMLWIEQQHIFKEIGRAVIMLNDPYSVSIEHSDYVDGVSRKDNFIWLDPLQRKKFFVKDGDTKHYITSKTALFDSANVHGSDPSDSSTFSIRFDGVFSEEFLKKTGLKKWTQSKI